MHRYDIHSAYEISYTCIHAYAHNYIHIQMHAYIITCIHCMHAHINIREKMAAQRQPEMPVSAKPYTQDHKVPIVSITH